MSHMMIGPTRDPSTTPMKRLSITRTILTISLFSVLIFLSGCGLIMTDPHPYPDMGGAGDEVESVAGAENEE